MKMKKLIILVSVLALALAACGGASSDGGGNDTVAPPSSAAGDAVAGADIYKSSCTACHGGDLAGVAGLGLPLAPSDFVSSQSAEDLAAFIAKGRPTSDPASTTGVDMPPKGGNPSLDDQDLLDLATYLQAQN